MQRKISLLLVCSLLVSALTACQPPAAESEPPAPAVEVACSDIVNGVWSGLSIGISTETSTYYGFEYGAGGKDETSPEEMAAYIQGAYGLEEGEWEEACIVREGGMSAVEMAALRFADEAAAQHGCDCLQEYLHGREGDFTGYAPAQAKLAADGALVREGLYVGLFLVEDGDYARQIFTTIVQTGEAPEPTPEPEPIDDVNELLEELLALCELQGDEVSDLERVDNSEPEKLKSILEEEYKLTDYPIEEAVIVRGTKGSAFELAVLRMGEGQGGTAGFDLCHVLTTRYLDVKENEAHFPAQAGLLRTAKAIHPRGTDFVVLMVCKEVQENAWEVVRLMGTNGYESAQRQSSASKTSTDPDPDYPSRTRFVDPGKDDMSIYDTSAIRAAWEAGSPEGLSGNDRKVYDAAEKILDEILQDGMTDLEKEEAVYRWLVNNVDYDFTHQDIVAETPRTSYEPYGGLVGRMAVCLGYATSFQLLMDLTGVECITVVGAAFNSEEDHAWNMVRLNGEWYCVDVTWDANGREQLGGDYEWRYFNITSDEMAQMHQWDYANTPEATAEDHGRP